MLYFQQFGSLREPSAKIDTMLKTFPNSHDDDLLSHRLEHIVSHCLYYIFSYGMQYVPAVAFCFKQNQELSGTAGIAQIIPQDTAPKIYLHFHFTRNIKKMIPKNLLFLQKYDIILQQRKEHLPEWQTNGKFLDVACFFLVQHYGICGMRQKTFWYITFRFVKKLRNAKEI